MDKNMKENIE